MANFDDDFLLAMELQKEFEKKIELGDNEIVEVPIAATTTQFSRNAAQRKRPRAQEAEDDLNMTQNLVHPQWEELDPTPDIHSLFGAFNGKFFQRRLLCVALEWSKRMYSCAGICYSRRNHMGMSITIRLSEPLLKLRSRKDLVETLLHEMIHAYCFVLGIREGNGGHGPNFKKIMNGINQVAGTNISVYHTFHDEVNLYKTHWWRCNGVCQNRKPFYGYVKRSSNRAPGPNDMWWGQHLSSCGGTFVKVKEPEKKKREKVLKNNKSLPAAVPPVPSAPMSKDLRSFFPPNNVSKGPVKSNGGGTVLINPKTNRTITAKPMPTASSTPSKSYTPPKVPGGNLKNVKGFKDLGDETPSKSGKPNDHTPSFPINGKGYSLSGPNGNTASLYSGNVDRDTLRSVWTNRFPANPVNTNDSKRRRILSDKGHSFYVADESNKNNWTITAHDDNILDKGENPEIIDLSSSEDEMPEFATTRTTQITQTVEERQKQIKQEIIDDDRGNESDIELIDDEYDDDVIATSIELADTSLVDDLFGEDTLLKDFNNSLNDVQSTSKASSDNISCPICQEYLPRHSLSNHLDGCAGITKKNPPKNTAGSFVISDGSKNKINSAEVQLLIQAGYTSHDLQDIVESEDEITSSEMHSCPICAKSVLATQINEHLDVCLGLQ